MKRRLALTAHPWSPYDYCLRTSGLIWVNYVTPRIWKPMYPVLAANWAEWWELQSAVVQLLCESSLITERSSCLISENCGSSELCSIRDWVSCYLWYTIWPSDVTCLFSFISTWFGNSHVACVFYVVLTFILCRVVGRWLMVTTVHVLWQIYLPCAYVLHWLAFNLCLCYIVIVIF